MRGSVQQKLQALHAQMQDAVDVYEREPAPARARDAHKEAQMALQAHEAQGPQQEMDLTPLLKDALDNLWSRPYDCRVFMLQLLQALAELDDRS
eukprot:157875-Prymnesium_polylepis.1